MKHLFKCKNFIATAKYIETAKDRYSNILLTERSYDCRVNSKVALQSLSRPKLEFLLELTNVKFYK